MSEELLIELVSISNTLTGIGMFESRLPNDVRQVVMRLVERLNAIINSKEDE